MVQFRETTIIAISGNWLATQTTRKRGQEPKRRLNLCESTVPCFNKLTLLEWFVRLIKEMESHLADSVSPTSRF